MRPRQQLDPLGQRGVPGHLAQLVGVGAHHVGQHMRIPGVALGPRDRMPLAVPGGLGGVDREHPIPGRDQRRDPRPPVGLDPDQHLPGPGLVVRVGEPPDQGVEPVDPGHPLRQPSPAQPPPRLVKHLHIVMIFCPVIADEQHPNSFPPTCPHLKPESVTSGRPAAD